MTTIQVNASKTYDIHIGKGLLCTVGTQIAGLGKVKKVCVVSETTVFPLYGKAVCESLTDAGLEVCHFVFPAGEASKNGETFLKLLNFLAENRLTRTDIIAALGGGVVGDLAGFAAASFLRGIRFVQIPTTVLAAVDSSVGGKTAIDLPAGKNLAGAFCQPSLVLCDTDTLNTLSEDIFRDGCAEVIKYAVLYDSRLFDILQRDGLSFDRESVIARCVDLKRIVVNEDEFDTGPRQKLNLGHTFGHAVEKLSNFGISHGKAVAIGTAMAARVAVKMELCPEADRDRIIQLLKQFKLPTAISYGAAELAQAALSDKKRSGGSINLILPRHIGLCDIVPTNVNQLESIFQAGL